MTSTNQKHTKPGELRRQDAAVKVQVLGTGCPKCKKVYAEVEKAIIAAEASVHLEKVDDISEILRFNVMMTPAVVVDGEVKSSGRIPSVEELVSWFQTPT